MRVAPHSSIPDIFRIVVFETQRKHLVSARRGNDNDHGN